MVGLFPELATVTSSRLFCWNEEIPHNYWQDILVFVAVKCVAKLEASLIYSIIDSQKYFTFYENVK